MTKCDYCKATTRLPRVLFSTIGWMAYEYNRVFRAACKKHINDLMMQMFNEVSANNTPEETAVIICRAFGVRKKYFDSVKEKYMSKLKEIDST